jgi:hypothetical protein
MPVAALDTQLHSVIEKALGAVNWIALIGCIGANLRAPGFCRRLRHATPSERILLAYIGLRCLKRLLGKRGRKYTLATSDCQGGGDSYSG